MSAAQKTGESENLEEEKEAKKPKQKPARPERIALHRLLAADDGTGYGPNLTAAVSCGTPNCG